MQWLKKVRPVFIYLAKFSKPLKRIAIVLLVIIVIGYLIPNKVSSPIARADISKIDPASFWYYPWGLSGVHKGIDIFCDSHTQVLSPVPGIVIKKGYGTIAGNYIYILGPRWRTYYFAHLDTVFVKNAGFVKRGQVIGEAGNTGNAAHLPLHLHFAIETIFPYAWQYSSSDFDGWNKMFYLDPIEQLGFNIEKDTFFKQ